jgi:hypothetical protein
MTENCTKPAYVSGKGLCMTCYSKAKKLVASGKTTWEELEELDMIESTKPDMFTVAFNKRKK